MLLTLAQQLADGLVSLVPRQAPAGTGPVRLVAHRGNCGNTDPPRENTLDAFRRCKQAGVFGIELDIQWTRDNVPVVIHDEDTLRVFGPPAIVIAETRFEDLRRKLPEVASLEEVIDRFAGSQHLMLELKDIGLSGARQDILFQALAGLEPVRDFHLLSLETAIFATLDRFPSSCFMAVAWTNTREIVKFAIDHRIGSVSGHYLLLSRQLRQQLRDAGIGVGVGFVPNASILYREISMGSDWLFTNHAARVQHAIDGLKV